MKREFTYQSVVSESFQASFSPMTVSMIYIQSLSGSLKTT